MVQLVDKDVGFVVRQVGTTNENNNYLDFHLIEPKGLSEATTGLVGKLPN